MHKVIARYLFPSMPESGHLSVKVADRNLFSKTIKKINK